MRMPVTLARPIARRQAHEIDPEICEPAGIAQALPHAFGSRRVELWWIERTFAFRHGGDVDFGHGAVPCHQRSSLPAGVIGYRLPRDEVISALFWIVLFRSRRRGWPLCGHHANSAVA